MNPCSHTSQISDSNSKSQCTLCLTPANHRMTSANVWCGSCASLSFWLSIHVPDRGFARQCVTQSSCLVGFLGWKHGWNRPNGRKLPMNRSLPDVFLSQRLKTAILVTVALRYSRYTGKKFQNVKNFSPPRTVISLAWWWPQKNLHFVLLGQKSWGCKVQHIKKWYKSANFQCRFGGRLTFWPAKKNSPELWLCWLDDGPKKICILAILARVISG